MSDRHPFDGEGLGYSDRLRFWDEYSDQYSGFQQGDIPLRVVDRLLDLGILRPGDRVLEIGSGPGTYSLELAPRVGSLTCMDTSPRMLDRLFASAEERGLTNMERLLQDWNSYVPGKGYDACMATLCPGTGTPESIMRMEGAARHGCAIVSWLENHGDDLNAEIWQRLGRDYGYGMRASTATYDWLRDNGRSPRMEILKARVRADIPIGSIVAKERSAFRSYGLEDRVEGIVMDILGPDLDEGVLHYDVENSMRLVTWTVPDG